MLKDHLVPLDAPERALSTSPDGWVVRLAAGERARFLVRQDILTLTVLSDGRVQATYAVHDAATAARIAGATTRMPDAQRVRTLEQIARGIASYTSGRGELTLPHAPYVIEHVSWHDGTDGVMRTGRIVDELERMPSLRYVIEGWYAATVEGVLAAD